MNRENGRVPIFRQYSDEYLINDIQFKSQIDDIINELRNNCTLRHVRKCAKFFNANK